MSETIFAVLLTAVFIALPVVWVPFLDLLTRLAGKYITQPHLARQAAVVPELSLGPVQASAADSGVEKS